MGQSPEVTAPASEGAPDHEQPTYECALDVEPERSAVAPTAPVAAADPQLECDGQGITTVGDGGPDPQTERRRASDEYPDLQGLAALGGVMERDPAK